METADAPDSAWSLIREQRAQLRTHAKELKALRRLWSDVHGDVATLRECLEDMEMLSATRFATTLHRRRFEAVQRKHPLAGDLPLSEVMVPYGVAEAVGMLAGPLAVQSVMGTQKSICKSMTSVLPSVKLLFPGVFYVLGGQDGDNILQSMERLDIVEDRWKPSKPMLQRRSRNGAASILGRLYVCGGCNGFEAVNTAECFDPSTEAWESLPPMVERRDGPAVAALDSRLYVCGGHGGNGATASVERFDPRRCIWEVLPSMQSKRNGAVAAAFAGRVIVCGGALGVNLMSSVESWSPATGSWEASVPMLERRFYASAAATGGRLYVCGGWGNGPQRLRSCESLPLGGNAWEALPPMSEGRVGATAAAVARKVYVFGGCGEGRCLNIADCFDPATRSWAPVAPTLSSRAFAAAAVLPE